MNPEFAVHKLTPEGLDECAKIAAKFDTLLNDLREICLSSTREFSLCKTKLEEACFFAKKAVAIHPMNQVKDGNQ